MGPLSCDLLMKPLAQLHDLIALDVLARECEADEDLTKLVVDIKGADDGAAALLIECRGEDADALRVRLTLHRISG